jgi:hypothetical protein
MSGADETVSVTLPSEDVPSTFGFFEDNNEPCWCVECGWDGLEDELMFTNEGVFVCPQCSSDDTDYYYSEESHSCIFCGSDDVVGVIDILNLKVADGYRIYDRLDASALARLDEDQVYGYCARCADVKMAEGSTGDQIISWEDGAGVSSPSMPPADIFWSESKKERIASGRAMHYAIPSEKKYPIWDKAHARMALAWSQGTKYADKVEKAVTKRFPTMNAETVYRNYPGRKGPSLSATSVKRGTRKRGNDGKMWEVRKSGRSQRWFRGAESFEGETLMGNWVDGRKRLEIPKGKFPKKNMTYGELLKFVQKMVIHGWEDYIINMYVKVKDNFDDPDYLEEWTVGNLGVDQGFELSVYPDEALIHEAESFEALGEPDAPYDQGYDDQQDESLGERNVTTGEQSLKDRRDEADAMDKKTGRKYHDVGTMDKLKVPGGRKMKFPEEPLARNSWKPGVDPESRLVPESVVPGMVLDAEGWGMTCQSADDNDEPCTAPATINLQDILMEYEVGEDPYEKGHLGEINEFYCKKHYEEDGYDSETKGSEHHKGQGYDDELDESLGMSHKESGMKQSFKDRRDESKGTEKFDHSRAYSRVKAMDAENMGLTQYVGSAGGSGDGTPVSYGGIALPESDVAAMVESSTENPMGASIGTVMGTMGAEEVPVVPDPSSFPQGDGRVLGQQTYQANLSPLHAEGDDVQMVKIQDPVTTGAKMALGVVALNATAIAGAALIGLALTYSARKEE